MTEEMDQSCVAQGTPELFVHLFISGGSGCLHQISESKMTSTVIATSILLLHQAKSHEELVTDMTDLGHSLHELVTSEQSNV